MKGYAMTGGEQLDAWIKRQGLQKKFVARQLGVAESTLTRWIKKTMPVPSAKHDQIERFTKDNDRLKGGADYLPRDIWAK